MGGLAGVIHFRGDGPDISVVQRMSQRLAHRGPDGEGSFAEGPVALAHRQRAVVPTAATQPLVGDDHVVLLDGWLYDHDDLANRAGATARTDIEMLLYAWRAWGVETARQVSGSFSAVVWHRREQVLHLIRDPAGARPLFWARAPGRFAFASELPALLEVPWVSRELAREHLAEYLSFQAVHAPRTLLRDVHQVEPAHYLRVSESGTETRRYWTPSYCPPDTAKPNDREVIEELEAAVFRAVRRRLPRGAKACLFMSGGLGSAAIAAAAARMNRPLPTYTISFTDDLSPEAPFAGRVARLLGLDHHEVVVGSSDIAESFDDAVAALGHPVGNPAVIIQLLLSRAAGQDNRIALSGHGSDELFGGRILDRTVRDLRSAKVFARVPFPFRRHAASLLRGSERGARLTTPPGRYGLELGLGGSNLFSGADRERLLRDAALIRPGIRREVLGPYYATTHTDPLNAILHAYFRSWLGDERLPRADRTAAASGIDPRFPMLDREIMKMASALPGVSKVRRLSGSLHTRWPLRAILDGVLPGPLLNRPKRTMPAPLGAWLVGPGRLFLEERLNRLRREPRGLYDEQALSTLRKNLTQSPQVAMKLWALFILDEWQRVHEVY